MSGTSALCACFVFYLHGAAAYRLLGLACRPVWFRLCHASYLLLAVAVNPLELQFLRA
jgi:hypothetical protein